MIPFNVSPGNMTDQQSWDFLMSLFQGAAQDTAAQSGSLGGPPTAGGGGVGSGDPMAQFYQALGGLTSGASGSGSSSTAHHFSTNPYVTTTDMVYMGPGKTKGITGGLQDFVKGAPDHVITTDAAQNQALTWNDSQIADAIKKFQDAGVTGVNDFGSMVSAWSNLVSQAAAIYKASNGARKLTPWDVLEMDKNAQIKAGTFVGPNNPNSQNFSGSVAQTQRSVSDISEGDAWQTLQSSLSQMLGRDPTDQEVRDFAYRMNALAAQNPSISKTISNYQNGRVVGSSTHTNPGFTAGDMAQAAYEQAQSDPGYAEYQAASTYYNAALSALGAIGG